MSALTRVRIAALWAFSITLALGAGRFAFVAVTALGGQDDGLAAVGDAPESGAQKARSAAEPSPAGDDGDDGEDGEDLPDRSEMISVMLSARHSREHSEVFMNETLIGYTTFMRDFSCRRGELLSLRIVPPKGRVVERVLRCEGPTLSISD